MKKFTFTNVGAPVATVVTLVVAAAGGAAFAALNMPAGWLCGALAAVTTIALAGFPARVPNALRNAVFLVLGISMGAAVTPETIAGIRTWPITMLFLALSVPASMAAVVLYLRWMGWDSETGFYASAPGALSSVLALAHEAGVDVRRVAFSQTVRVFLLIAALPGVLAFLNQGGTGIVIAGMPTGGDIGEIVLMATAGVAAGLLAERFHVPGGLIVGAMAASAAMHATGYVSARLPLYALVPGFIVLGALIGARFIGTELSMVRRMLLDSVGAFFVSIFVTVFFALAAAPLAGENLGKTIVAYAPGALEAMIILAFMLDLDPAFVGAHHLARFLMISVLLPFAAYLVFGRPGLKR